MLRALFRRLPLAASLGLLVSVSLFAGGPAAHAASQAVSPVCQTGLGDNFQHCYVAINITAPSLDASSGIDNSGVASTLQIFNPIVGKNDSESLAQETAGLCWPSCGTSAIFTAALEFGWVVSPKVYGDPSPHLFVF